MADDHNRLVVGTFQVKLMLSQQREFLMTGHLYSDDTPAQVNARVDAAQDVADRQLIRADVFQKEAQIEAMVAAIGQHKDQLEALAAKQKMEGEKGPSGGRVRLTSQEKQILDNGRASVKGLESQVVSLRAAIVKARAKLGAG